MISCLVSALLAQAPVATAPGAPPAAESGPTISGNLAFGAIILRGNSETATFTFGSAGQHKTATWIFGYKVSAAYGRSTDPTTAVSSTTALNGALSMRADRRLNRAVAVYVEAAADTDHLKSNEARPTGEGGVSFRVADVKEGDFQTEALRLDAGFRAGREYRFQYYPTRVNLDDRAIAAPTAGFAFRYAFTHDTIFSDEAVALVNIPEGPRLLLTNVAKLSTRLAQRLSFLASYGIAEDSSPPAGKSNLDTSLTFALEATF
ncbi:MAG: DUF481 domain-containing protein [Myxococcales bacterium]